MGDSDSGGNTNQPESVTLNTGFSGRLKEVRQFFKQSQSGMDQLLGIGKKSWQRYESGGTTPGAPVITELVKRGINANWLLEGVGPMHYPSEDAQNAGEMMVRDVLEGDEVARTYREQRAQSGYSRLRQADQALKEALDYVDYEPPVDVRETLRELLLGGHLDAAGAAILLQRLRKTLKEGNSQ